MSHTLRPTRLYLRWKNSGTFPQSTERNNSIPSPLRRRVSLHWSTQGEIPRNIGDFVLLPLPGEREEAQIFSRLDTFYPRPGDFTQGDHL